LVHEHELFDVGEVLNEIHAADVIKAEVKGYLLFGLVFLY